MSFYGKPKSSNNETKDTTVDVTNDEVFENVEEAEHTTSDEMVIEPARQMQFSVRQSNILYILFIFGFFLSVGADVLHQFTR